MLQVAALVREADALALAQALQQKKFPAFVLTPGDDHFYRVQVGPYADAAVRQRRSPRASKIKASRASSSGERPRLGALKPVSARPEALE